MRRSGPDNLLHPAVLLALSLTLCGGSLYAANQPGAVLQNRIAERATELTASQRETVAQLMHCLAEAAKELQKHDVGGAITDAPTAIRQLVSPHPQTSTPDDAPPIACRVLLHHLDLPPPAVAL